MSQKNINQAKKFYEQSYKNLGFDAQRRWPNEELCRFMGRNFFSIPPNDRKNYKILETGCGSGANLWMIAKEGFDAYGVDLSQEGLSLCQAMLTHHETNATISNQNMAELTFPENYFDAVVDVFSSYCLTSSEHMRYLRCVANVLKPGGKFFSYFPSKASDTFQYPGDSVFLDVDTLAGVSRSDSPFSGQEYPFRFMHPREYENALESCGLVCVYLETNMRTYRKQNEIFSFVVIEGIKSN